MDYITEIFERANLQHIREYLLHGGELIEIDSDTYQERLNKGQKIAIEMIKRKFPDMKEYEPITREVYHALSVYEEVYLEIGLQVGFKLAKQIVC